MSKDAKRTDAINTAQELKKWLISKGIWFTISEVHKVELDCIKVEVIIKA